MTLGSVTMTRTPNLVTLFVTTIFVLTFTSSAYACDVREPTRGTSAGPHDFSAGIPDPKLWQEGDEGEPLYIRARVLDACGKPVIGARIRIVHANRHGDHEPDRWRADLTSDDRGSFSFVTVLPGYAGGLPRHIHFVIDHPDYPQLVTRLYFKNDSSVDQSVEDLAMVLEEIDREEGKGWIADYEFVLAPK